MPIHECKRPGGCAQGPVEPGNSRKHHPSARRLVLLLLPALLLAGCITAKNMARSVESADIDDIELQLAANPGLLTMGEIMRLRLDADWIVLSACNTGAGRDAGAEAVSGLGRAFIYAGSRALLVSMWPVETTAARQLTTGIFTRQQADPRLGRARALQQSIMALIDDPGYADPRSGQPAASYAHPLFWAPFIVYGEGGAE